MTGESVLRMGRTLYPDRFPEMTPEVVMEWNAAVADIELPEEVLISKVRYRAMNLAGQREVTSSDLRSAAIWALKLSTVAQKPADQPLAEVVELKPRRNWRDRQQIAKIRSTKPPF